MASESSLLYRWHQGYQITASGMPLKKGRHPAYQKRGVSHPLTVEEWFHLPSKSQYVISYCVKEPFVSE